MKSSKKQILKKGTRYHKKYNPKTKQSDKIQNKLTKRTKEGAVHTLSEARTMLKKRRMSCMMRSDAITQLTAVACMFLSILERLYAKYKLYLAKMTHIEF